MKNIQSLNPFSNEVNGVFEPYSSEKVKSIIDKSGKAFEEWKNFSFADRSIHMQRAAENLLLKKESLAVTIVKEMGKPIKEALAEIEKCAFTCQFFADHAEAFLKEEEIQTDATRSFITYQPLGCILAIMPWNFPFWQVFRFAAPALMAGNVGLLKHASNVPLCALEIEKIFLESGFPEGVFQALLIGPDATESVIAHPIVKAVTLTGSESAGASVAMIAGKYLKKAVLELGGSDPFIVLSDANIEEASTIAVKARLINSGQSCIAAKRFIIEESIYDDFLLRMKEKMERLKVGDPMSPDVELGPLARKDLLESLVDQISISEKMGAQIITGGKKLGGKAAILQPTILTNVNAGMPAFEEELFGPVAVVFKVKNEDEAIRVANETRYGLGASIWTQDLQKGVEIGKRIESGALFINGMVFSDPRLPFGGIKKSGYGRELSYHGIREFVNIRTFWVK